MFGIILTVVFDQILFAILDFNGKNALNPPRFFFLLRFETEHETLIAYFAFFFSNFNILV